MKANSANSDVITYVTLALSTIAAFQRRSKVCFLRLPFVIVVLSHICVILNSLCNKQVTNEHVEQYIDHRKTK